MDNELQELEAELKRLRPLAPSRAVTDDVARKLTAAPRDRRNLWAWTQFNGRRTDERDVV